MDRHPPDLLMIIGIPRETKNNERRVALTPLAVADLIRSGQQVLLESGAGLGSGFSDEVYARAGAEIRTVEQVYATADLLLKVKEPQPAEYAFYRSGQILFTFLHLAADDGLRAFLESRQVVALAYELVLENRRFPILEPMSEIAGRMATLVGAHYLASPSGGCGKLLSGVPGVLPARVLVVGGGTAGLQAARMACGLGAEVIIADIDPQRLRHLDGLGYSHLKTVHSTPAKLSELLPSVDLVIGAVLRPGERAPCVITRTMVASMKEGAVLVDIAIDQGGCAETSRATTHENPVFTECGVLHYCVANMPGAYPRTATEALVNATLPYVQRLARHGWSQALATSAALRNALTTPREALQ